MIAELLASAVVAAPPPVSFSYTTSHALPGARVTITARGSRLRRPVRLYLVRSDHRSGIRSPLDSRLAYVGLLRPRAGRGAVTFDVPPLTSGSYTAWCSGCGARSSRALHIEMPPVTETACPVTTARGQYYGHDLLQTVVPGGGVLERRPEADGTIFDKLPWVPRRGVVGRLTLAGTRLDAAGRLRVLAVNWGYSSDGRGSWATAVKFPAPGCWKLRARLRPFSGRYAVDLSYVVKVVRG